jgi:peptidyl-prolyl cis-trans isomerase SurA
MERMVWKKANLDDSRLKAYHALNKSKYKWRKSVSAAIISLPNREMAIEVRNNYLKDNSLNNIRKRYSDIAQIDTGRYEASELIGIGEKNAKTGFAGEINTNESDGVATFVVIAKVYNDPSLKTFSEAEGQVINDYQQSLEDRWIADMKRKYPVVVNPKVWSGLLSR